MTAKTTLIILIGLALTLGGATVITIEMVDGVDRGDALYGSVQDDPPQRRDSRF